MTNKQIEIEDTFAAIEAFFSYSFTDELCTDVILAASFFDE